VHILHWRPASVQHLRDSPIRLNRGRTQVFASSNESFGVRGEAERHTAFLRFASIANHLAHWRITPGRKKRRRRFPLPAQSKKCDKKMSPNWFQATIRRRRCSESCRRFERNNCSEVSSVSSRALRKLS